MACLRTGCRGALAAAHSQVPGTLFKQLQDLGPSSASPKKPARDALEAPQGHALPPKLAAKVRRVRSDALAAQSGVSLDALNSLGLLDSPASPKQPARDAVKAPQGHALPPKL